MCISCLRGLFQRIQATTPGRRTRSISILLLSAWRWRCGRSIRRWKRCLRTCLTYASCWTSNRFQTTPPSARRFCALRHASSWCFYIFPRPFGLQRKGVDRLFTGFDRHHTSKHYVKKMQDAFAVHEDHVSRRHWDLDRLGRACDRHPQTRHQNTPASDEAGAEMLPSGSLMRRQGIRRPKNTKLSQVWRGKALINTGNPSPGTRHTMREWKKQDRNQRALSETSQLRNKTQIRWHVNNKKIPKPEKRNHPNSNHKQHRKVHGNHTPHSPKDFNRAKKINIYQLESVINPLFPSHTLQGLPKTNNRLFKRLTGGTIPEAVKRRMPAPPPAVSSKQFSKRIKEAANNANPFQ